MCGGRGAAATAAAAAAADPAAAGAPGRGWVQHQALALKCTYQASLPCPPTNNVLAPPFLSFSLSFPFPWLQDAFYRQGLPNIMQLLATVAIFLMVVYFQVSSSWRCQRSADTAAAGLPYCTSSQLWEYNVDSTFFYF